MAEANQCNNIDSSAENTTLNNNSVAGENGQQCIYEAITPPPSENNNVSSTSENNNPVAPQFNGNLNTSSQNITNYNNGTVPSIQPSHSTPRHSGNFNSNANIPLASDVPPNINNSFPIMGSNLNTMAAVPTNFTHMPIESANYNPVPAGFNHVPAIPSNFNRLRMQPAVNINSVPFQAANSRVPSAQNFRSIPPQNFNQRFIRPNFNQRFIRPNFNQRFIRPTLVPGLDKNRELARWLISHINTGTFQHSINGRLLQRKRNSGQFQNNMNGGPFQNNISGGPLQNNMSAGQFQNNANGGQLQNNMNGGQFQNNTNGEPAQFQNNMNGGQFQNNTNGGQFQNNMNGGQFQNNISRGSIQNNTNGGPFQNNMNGGPFQNNINRGSIQNNTNVGPFQNNINGGQFQNSMSSGQFQNNINLQSTQNNGARPVIPSNGGMVAVTNGGPNTINLNGQFQNNINVQSTQNNGARPVIPSNGGMVAVTNGGPNTINLNGQFQNNINVQSSQNNGARPVIPSNGGMVAVTNGGPNTFNLNGRSIATNGMIPPHMTGPFGPVPANTNLNSIAIMANINGQLIPGNINIASPTTNLNVGPVLASGTVSNNMTVNPMPRINNVSVPGNLNGGPILVNMNGTLVQGHINYNFVKDNTNCEDNDSLDGNLSYENVPSDVNDSSVEEYMDSIPIPAIPKHPNKTVASNSHNKKSQTNNNDQTMNNRRTRNNRQTNNNGQTVNNRQTITNGQTNNNEQTNNNGQTNAPNLSEKPTTSKSVSPKPDITINGRPVGPTNQNLQSASSILSNKKSKSPTPTTSNQNFEFNLDDIPCRMSWFLIKEEKTQNYCIVHAVDIQEDYTDIFLNRKIKFNKGRCAMVGTVITASDDYKIIESQFNKLKPESIFKALTPPAPSTSKYQWFLVQYINRRNNIVHFMCNLNNISPYNQPLDSNDIKHVVVREADRRYLGRLLYRATTEEQVLDQLITIRKLILDMVCKTTVTDDKRPDFDKFSSGDDDDLSEQFILVQYSDGVNRTIYAVFSEMDTTWKFENLFKNAVTYIKDKNDEAVYQAFILKRSTRFYNVTKILKNIKVFTLVSQFPIKMKNNSENADYTLGTCRIIKKCDIIDVEYIHEILPRTTKDLINLYKKDKNQIINNGRELYADEDNLNYHELEETLRKVEAMEKQMYEEQEMIENALRDLKRRKMEAQFILFVLDYLLSLDI